MKKIEIFQKLYILKIKNILENKEKKEINKNIIKKLYYLRTKIRWKNRFNLIWCKFCFYNLEEIRENKLCFYCNSKKIRKII